MASNLTIGGGAVDSGEPDNRLRSHYQDKWGETSEEGLCEIEEDFTGHVLYYENKGSNRLDTIKEDVEGSLFSIDFHGNGESVVYVAVGRQNEESSMDALIWAIKNATIPSSTVVFLIHVFPETKFIPSPLGMLSINQVNPEQKEIFLAQERGQRNEFLRKFIKVCSTSQIKVDTILIESDAELKAVLDLIPILNIRKLVLGTTKANMKRMKSKKGSGFIDQILQNAPEFCDVKVIYEGKEMLELMTDSPMPSSSPSPSPSPRASDWSARFFQDQEQSPKFSRDQEQASKNSAGCGVSRFD